MNFKCNWKIKLNWKRKKKKQAQWSKGLDWQTGEQGRKKHPEWARKRKEAQKEWRGVKGNAGQHET